jgi:hypothetical protein
VAALSLREQESLRAQLAGFAAIEQGDAPVLPVVPGLHPHLAGPHAAHRFAQRLPAQAGHLRHGQLQEQAQLSPAAGQQLVVAARHHARLGAGARDLGQDFLQRDQGVEVGPPRRPAAQGPVGQLGHPVQHPDGHRLSAHGA